MKSCYTKVTICTQAYNAEQYLTQCIKSVLKQTYQNFEYFIINNGSTDASDKTIRYYEALDTRIRTFQYEENQACDRFSQIINKYAKGDYCTVIDADDWWEPNYLQRLITFLEDNRLDLAITGTVNFYESAGIHRTMRKLETPVVFTIDQLAHSYPQYWTFPSTNWANIMKTTLRKQVNPQAEYLHFYGADTIAMLKCMEKCCRIGIDDSALYHYRIHAKGISYYFQPNRLEANTTLFECMKNFLLKNHALDSDKEYWLKCVHLNSLITTIRLLSQSDLSLDDKGAECVRIASHPLTIQTLSPPCPEERYTLCDELLKLGIDAAQGGGEDYFSTVAIHITPQCKGICKTKYVELLHKEPGIWKALIADDVDQLMNELLTLVEQKKYSKRYNLAELIRCLLPEDTLLHVVDDVRFIQKYIDIYCLIFQEHTLEALDLMTGMLLDDKCHYGRELFLSLYLSLASMENQVSAFLFGKLQLAQHLLQEGRLEECRSILDEMDEMGIEENDDLLALRDALKRQEGDSFT